MNDILAVERFSALAQPTRLALFRMLLKEGADGLPAGELVRRLDAPASTVSAHLAILTRVGLTRAARSGRVIRYRVDVGAVQELLDHLLAECCGGRPELCQPLIETLSAIRAGACGARDC